MMFEAFGFMQERTLRCRQLSQLPSGGCFGGLPAFSDLFQILKCNGLLTDLFCIVSLE